MKSDGKYKSHLIKNLANKKCKYMPSISSISDLSLDGKNKKWSRRWNHEVQSGAGSSSETGYSDYTLESLDNTSKNSREIDKEDKKSSVGSQDKSNTGSSENVLNSTELEEYKNKIKDHYKRLYLEKYNRYGVDSEDLNNKSSYNNLDFVTNSALIGLAFWPSYNEALKNSFKKDELKGRPLKGSLAKQISDNCHQVDTKGLCPRCRYNYLKDCENICDIHNNQNGIDILVTRSNSGKVIDSFTVNLDPKRYNKSLLNSINIKVKSNRSGRMDKYSTKNRCVETEVVNSPKIKIESPFANNFSKDRSYSVTLNNNVGKKTGCVVHDKKCNPDRIVEVNVDKSPNVGINRSKTIKSSGVSDLGKSPKVCASVVNTPTALNTRNYDTYNKLMSTTKGAKYVSNNNKPLHNDEVYTYVKPENNVGFKLVASNDSKSLESSDTEYVVDRNVNVDENNIMITNLASTSDSNADYDYSHRQTKFKKPSLNYYNDVTIDCDELNRLIKSKQKLHGFKINNKGVNVPLFLNIGTRDSPFSGQAFVSGSAVGLFKISVVQPIEPKVDLANKIVDLVGLNNYRGSSCKCTSINPSFSIKKALPATGEVLNNIFNCLQVYGGMSWVSSLKTYVSEQIDAINKTLDNIETPEVNVCDFHKNLFVNNVDRTRFGKDVYCQLKYINSVATQIPLKLDKRHFTSGSNVSSYFNGFHEQMLCIADTSNMNRNDLYNNNNFTFIIRRVKGSRYGKNFTILNTTSGQHLCLDMLTYELRFEEECKFSKYLVPAIFKIIPLPDIVEAISFDTFNCFKPSRANPSDMSVPSSDEYDNCDVDRINRYPTYMSTTDQYINLEH